jgi:hypothetical protein
MDQKKILLVTVKNTRDKDLPDLTKSEAKSLSLWISSIVKSNAILITSPTLECIKFSQIIVSSLPSLSLNVKILEKLSSKNPSEYLSMRLNASTVIEIDGYNSPKDVDKLIKFIFQDHSYSYGIIVIEEETFLDFKLKSNSRGKKGCSLYICDFRDNSNRLKLTNDFIQKIEHIFKNVFFNLIHSKHSEIKDKYFYILKSLKEIPVATRKISKNIKDSYIHGQIEFNTQLNEISNTLKAIMADISSAKDSINLYQELASIYINPVIPNSKLIIRRFYYDDCKNLWKIKIYNPNDENFKKVEVFIAEYERCICRFDLIQHKTSVVKYIELSRQDYWNLHLVAVSVNTFVSKAFTIHPYHLSINKLKSDSDKAYLKITNYSTDSDTVIIVSNKQLEPLFKLTEPLDYQESFLFKVDKKSFDQAKVFAVSSGHKASNSLGFNKIA